MNNLFQDRAQVILKRLSWFTIGVIMMVVAVGWHYTDRQEQNFSVIFGDWLVVLIVAGLTCFFSLVLAKKRGREVLLQIALALAVWYLTRGAMFSLNRGMGPLSFVPYQQAVLEWFALMLVLIIGWFFWPKVEPTVRKVGGWLNSGLTFYRNLPGWVKWGIIPFLPGLGVGAITDKPLIGGVAWLLLVLVGWFVKPGEVAETEPTPEQEPVDMLVQLAEAPKAPLVEESEAPASAPSDSGWVSPMPGFGLDIEE